MNQNMVNELWLVMGEMEKALEFYSNDDAYGMAGKDDVYTIPVMEDMGLKAKYAMSRLRELAKCAKSNTDAMIVESKNLTSNHSKQGASTDTITR